MTATAPPAGISALAWLKAPANTSSGCARKAPACAGAMPARRPWLPCASSSSTTSGPAMTSPPDPDNSCAHPDAHAALTVDVLVVGAQPATHLGTDMPGSVVPDQEQRRLPCLRQAHATPR